MPGLFDTALNPQTVDPETLAAFVDEEPAASDPQGGVAPSTDAPPAQSSSQESAPPAGSPPTGETPAPEPAAESGETAAEQARRWANKYESPEDLERAYLHLQALQTRTFQDNQSYEQRVAQLEDGLRQAMPYIELGAQAARAQQGGQPVQGPAEVIDFDDPESLRRYIDQQVNQRTQALVAQQQQAQQAQIQQQTEMAYRQAGEAAIEAFSAKHPDVMGNTDAETQVAEMVRIYNLDMRDPDQLELAWEIWQNPLVGEAVAANPIRVTSPQGRAEARFIAAQMAAARPGTLPASQGPPAAGAPPARPRSVPHIETGSGAPITGPPSGAQPDRDEFDDVLDLARSLASGDAFHSRPNPAKS